MKLLINLLLLFFVVISSLSFFLFDDISAKKPESGIPDQVQNLVVTNVEISQIDLLWDEPNNNGYVISGYQIERKSQGPWAVIVSDTANSDTTFSDTGLDADTTYRYRVSAINEMGIGTASDVVIATTASEIHTIPSKVVGLSATVMSPSQINLSWTTPGNGGMPITGYQIEQKHSPWTIMVPDTGNAFTTYSVTGLDADTTYQYRVSAINAMGLGPASNTVTATTMTATIPPVESPILSKGGDDQTLPRFTGLEILYGEQEDYKLYQLDDTHEILPQKILQSGQEAKIRVRIDDNEATSNILHFGMYMDIRDRTSQISKSNAYVIYEKGKTPSIIDSNGLFESVDVNSVFEEHSMWIEVTVIFQKPMQVSDIILETWNEGRHPVYFTIPNMLEIKSDTLIDSNGEVKSDTLTNPNEDEVRFVQEQKTNSNISGTVFIPEKPSKEPIIVYSTAMGKKTQIKNNQEFTIENQDLGVEISGYYENGRRGQVIILTTFHPDETTHIVKTFLDSKNHYLVPTKLSHDWQSGIYQVIAKAQTGQNENECEIFGKIKFFINDGTHDGFAGILPESENIIKAKCAYLDEKISEDELRQILTSEGVSQENIDKFIAYNPRPISHLFYPVVIVLVGVLFVLTLALGPKRNYPQH